MRLKFKCIKLAAVKVKTESFRGMMEKAILSVSRSGELTSEQNRILRCLLFSRCFSLLSDALIRTHVCIIITFVLAKHNAKYWRVPYGKYKIKQNKTKYTFIYEMQRARTKLNAPRTEHAMYHDFVSVKAGWCEAWMCIGCKHVGANGAKWI